MGGGDSGCWTTICYQSSTSESSTVYERTERDNRRSTTGVGIDSSTIVPSAALEKRAGIDDEFGTSIDIYSTTAIDIIVIHSAGAVCE